MSVTKVLSGAQTGTDRASLDWAIFQDVPHGGWCPKDRKAEDGKIPPQYQLTETPIRENGIKVAQGRTILRPRSTSTVNGK